ncbi:DUF6289 family protein [Rhodanobacter ginsenosidimutans]|uniref:DUF6289 family protein n=1 Tax=Rhodanobacter ginsenosidimutans TaxID=490571 RepID=A0ABW0JYD0_9GAMM
MKSSFRLLACATALAGIGGLTISSSAFSRPPTSYFETYNIYYNNASHAAVVGVRHYYCDGRVNNWGKVTPYKIEQGKECVSGGPDGPDPGDPGFDWPIDCTTLDPVYGCH